MIILDENQHRVASHKEGPALVLAGAGAGKTASIIGRTLELVESGVPSSRILLLTFSRKAAREMRERAMMAFGEGGATIQASTFHAFCGRIFRQYESVIRPPLIKPQAQGNIAHTGTDNTAPSQKIQEHQGDRVTQLDEGGQSHIAMEAIRRQYKDPKEAELALKEMDWRKWLSAYDRLRSEGYTAQAQGAAQMTTDFINAWWRVEFTEAQKDPMAGDLYQFAVWYETEKRLAHVIDFGDLINLPFDFLRANPSALAKLAHRYDQIIIDEAQDMDAAQYQGIQRLARAMPTPNLMLVGDDDQSIYGFRGSSPSVLRYFADIFRPEIYRLERNYRSTREIVQRASQHVAHNRHRIPKEPFSERETEESIFAYRHETDMDVLYWITRRLLQAHADGAPWSSFAVLYRSRRFGPQISALLVRYRIPFVIYGGLSFFEYLEVKFAGAYARLATNPRDSAALRDLSPLLPGVGDRYMDLLHAALMENPTFGFVQAAEACASNRFRTAHQSILKVQKTLRHLLQSNPETWGKTCWEYENSGIRVCLEKADAKEYADDKSALIASLKRRQDNLGFFDQMITDVIHEADAEEAKHPVLLIAGMFVTDAQKKDEDGDRVVLATVHACKGLEFDEVHIPGFVQPLMPWPIDDDRDITTLPPDDQQRIYAQREEERRISYVALTRAKHRLFLHVPGRFVTAANLMLNGAIRAPYLNELGLTAVPAPFQAARMDTAVQATANVIPFRPKPVEEDCRGG